MYSRFTGDKFNVMKDRKVCVDDNKFDLGKNGCHMPNGLGSRLIVVVRKKG